MVESSSSAESLVFAEVLYADLWVGTRAVLDEIAEDALVVVADDEDFADLGDFGDCLEAVFDDGVSCDFEEGLYGING